MVMAMSYVNLVNVLIIDNANMTRACTLCTKGSYVCVYTTKKKYTLIRVLHIILFVPQSQKSLHMLQLTKIVFDWIETLRNPIRVPVTQRIRLIVKYGLCSWDCTFSAWSGTNGCINVNQRPVNNYGSSCILSIIMKVTYG